MVTTRESHVYQLIFAWDLSNLDQMALLQSKQNYSLPWIQPLSLTERSALPGQSVSKSPSSNCEQEADVARFLKPVPLCSSMPHLTGAAYPIDQHAVSHELVLGDKANDTSEAPQRRFLIFDQSGNQMKIFFSPSPSNQIFNEPRREVATHVGYLFSREPDAEETWDENHLPDEEVDILEDTDEIDALLYSDGDDEWGNDDDDGGGGGNDEVMSSGCSPFIIGEGYEKDKSPEEHTEEVVNSDEKRQRLLDGQYKKSSLPSTESLKKHETISPSYLDDVNSSCAGDCNSISYDDTSSSKRLKKVKVRQALKTLEGIIPGLTSNDPLSIIDKAIIYLKSMKTEAEALGLIFPDSTSSASPFHTPDAAGRAESLHQWAS